MIEMIKPRALRSGDRVAAISLSAGKPSAYPAAYQDGKRQLEEAFGVQVIESRHALAHSDWLAAHPEARAEDLMEVLSDPSIQGIVSTIGGDDSIRMLPFLDLSFIRENPKVFLGYSDSTITHFAFLKAGVTSFYGPSIMAGFDENGGLLPYTAESVRQALFEPVPSKLISPNNGGWTGASFGWGDEKRNEKRRPLQPCSGWQWIRGIRRIFRPHPRCARYKKFVPQGSFGSRKCCRIGFSCPMLRIGICRDTRKRLPMLRRQNERGR